MTSGAPGDGTPIAEGLYSYTIDDRARATELWRLRRLSDGRQHMQALLSIGQQVAYGMDLLVSADGHAEALQARAQNGADTAQAAFTFAPGLAQGQIVTAAGPTPVQVALPAGTVVAPESIATRWLLANALNFATDAEQPLPLCLVPVLDAQRPPLLPAVVAARASVLGAEPVELLMATVTATHVVLEWPGQPPQHVWFDEHRFPVRWYWVALDPDGGGSVAHDFSLARYARFP